LSVAQSDIKMYQAATMPTSLATTLVGGAINTGAQVLGSTIGEIFFPMGSAVAGGGNKTQYSKAFIKNTNSATDGSGEAYVSLVYLLNGLDDKPAGNHTVSVVSDSAADGSSLKARFIGLDNAGAPQQEEVILNGLTPVVTTNTWSALHRITIHLVSDSTLANLTGSLTATSNSVRLGMVPAGHYSATAEVQFALVATLDDSGTTTNAATAPATLTFAKPNLTASGTACANSGVITHGAAQGIWFKLTHTEAQKPSADVEVLVKVEFQTL
jgi:hypothetical protein